MVLGLHKVFFPIQIGNILVGKQEKNYNFNKFHTYIFKYKKKKIKPIYTYI